MDYLDVFDFAYLLKTRSIKAKNVRVGDVVVEDGSFMVTKKHKRGGNVCLEDSLECGGEYKPDDKIRCLAREILAKKYQRKFLRSKLEGFY